MIADAELASVFGQKVIERTLVYNHYGESMTVTVG
jgi:hypothetical protein